MPGADGETRSISSDLARIATSRMVDRLNHESPPRSTRRRVKTLPKETASPNSTDAACRVAAQLPTGESHLQASRRKRPRFKLSESILEALQMETCGCAALNKPLDLLVADIIACIRASKEKAEVAWGVVHALRDPLNTELRQMVVTGSLSPQALVDMDEESLLNPQIRQVRQAERQERIEQQSIKFLERLHSTVTYMYVCPACGGKECYANFRNTDYVKWQGDDGTPTLLTCTKCDHVFRQ